MPVLVYDGDCGFCTWVASHGARLLPASVDVVPFQQADLPSLGLSLPEVETAVQWVSPGLGPLAGHQAVAAWLVASGFPWSVLGRVMVLPGLSWLFERIYHVTGFRGRGDATAPGVPSRPGYPGSDWP
jgi:hypothetical protein